MELGMIGLGRMGANMVQRLVEGGHRVVGYDRSATAVADVVARGAEAATSLEDVVARLTPPRALWLMVPAGDPVTQTIASLTPLLAPGDTIIDGGNSNFKDSMRRGEELRAQGFTFADCGTSGGIWGLRNGYCLMVGGDSSVIERIEPLFLTLAPTEGYAHVGPIGAGHYTKMVHNGIEYALLQSYAEGFEILRASSFNLDLGQLAHLWNHGSVVRSWLLELAEDAFARDPNLDAIRGYVEDSGEGRWTVQDAIDHNVPAPLITLSLLERFRSRQDESFAAKVIAALRNEFGGHAVKKN